jgi:glutathione S-transferase
MSDLILHHYPMSPFSEKIRVMLGYSQIHWQSVLTREMPPRPLVARLAGGYRKIPVAQIGADIFCDSRTIAKEIATLANKPALALENCSAEVQTYVGDVDTKIFFACVFTGGSGKLSQKARQTMSFFDLARFIWDRVNMGRKATVAITSFREAKPLVLRHLAVVEDLLEQDFIFGMEPNHADFSTYHGLWFIRDLGESPMVSSFPKTIAWMDRMKAFGEGARNEISGEQALNIAGNSSPRPIAAEHCTDSSIGKDVQIAPSDYAQTPTAGVLVGVTPSQWILARQESGLGTLHVHFPQQGFSLTPTN